MKRDIFDYFRKWKEKKNRKPLLLEGARQTGKTWCMETFGKECFKYWVKFDFDRQAELKNLFKITKEPARLIRELSLYSDVPIKSGETLVIFDEIQECEEALNSLKYFCEDMPELHIMSAGSLLGVTVRRKGMTVPVGKVDVVRLYPMTFREFLRVSDTRTYEYVDALDRIEHLPEIILNKLKTEYRRYQVCGGMPEPVKTLLENRGIEEVDKELQDILNLYELDFAKYADSREIPRINAIWNSLPAQLSKENRKFIYNVIRSGARSKDYEDSLLWLGAAGLIYRIFDISKPGLPLSAYKESNVFKVYGLDCGLIRKLSNLPASAILNPISNYTEFKGAMAENAVLQCLLPQLDGNMPYFWTSAGKAEVEFVLQLGLDVIPVEVKAETNISGNSLSVYTNKYNPPFRIRYSMKNLQYNGGLLSCPAPLASWILKFKTLLGK
ncbi:MAG: ATP-binding protein [Muribaculaceae bacterium]|nr:ATP-binding protein [Muribaculaceae bacterium]